MGQRPEGVRVRPLRFGLLWLVLLVFPSACGHASPAALPEVLVVVDTDLPTPLVAARLRVDLYAEDGTWFDSSDFGRPDPRDWPASFSVYSDDDTRDRSVWVRLRAYPEGGVDSYAGPPRLVQDGNDVTPATEPSALVTVDRLLLIRLRPGHPGRVQALLHGACVGTVVRLGAGGAPHVGDTDSCVDTAQTRASVAESSTDDDLTTPSASSAGTWLVAPCPAAAPDDPRVCVPGGATILGSREDSDYLAGTPDEFDSAPPRVFGLSPFLVDRDELTVDALAALVASGYAGTLPTAYDGTLAQPTTSNKSSGCTWSKVAKDRGPYPVTCASFRAAQEICQYRGGDLPTETQWEHVATIAGHPTKVRYPWGQDLPTCAQAIWGRIPLGTPTAECSGGDGPRLPSEAGNDLSPLGIRNLFGSVSEWVLDDAAAFDSSAWASVSLVDPRAESPDAHRILRGSSWMSSAQRPIFRFAPADTAGYAPVGVRCAYPMRSP